MENRVNLYIQPAYNYTTKNIEYAEVLIRGYKGIDTVDRILKFVKLNKMEKKFDIDVITQTLQILSNYNKLSYPIGINLCPTTIEEEGIAEEIIDLLIKYNNSGNDIIIEVNEGTDFKNKNVRENIRKLRANGIRIALDDFGMDGANLYSLLSCNIDILKVDKAFIESTKIEYEESQSKILKRLLQICDDFNLKHIIEGIETKKQLNSIIDIGYSVVQGYLYERPVKFVDFLESTIKEQGE